MSEFVIEQNPGHERLQKMVLLTMLEVSSYISYAFEAKELGMSIMPKELGISAFTFPEQKTVVDQIIAEEQAITYEDDAENRRISLLTSPYTGTEVYLLSPLNPRKKLSRKSGSKILLQADPPGSLPGLISADAVSKHEVPTQNKSKIIRIGKSVLESYSKVADDSNKSQRLSKIWEQL